jgi:pyruvate ferredoxin oxidoreductase alpha subunit/phenylglyoxylate dehydrogenase alpha subunit
MKALAITGNISAALGCSLARPDLIAAYPITPQSSVVEHLALLIAEGKLDSRIVHVESEHSAMSVLSGASLAGGRTFTATSSQGLALMYEPYFRVSTLRLPVIMPIACREMTSPSSIWCGQQDAMSVREAGWIQVYVENNQEILDMVIQGYKLAEDPDILLPMNICYDGFYLSHLVERVELPEQSQVDSFLPPFKQYDAKLDPDDPMAVDPLTEGSILMQYRMSHLAAMKRALTRVEEIDREYAQVFGRSYGGLVEGYRMEDAEIALVTIGSMTGTAREAIDQARSNGVRAGLVKVRFMRPFPAEALRNILAGVKAWAVVDRSVSFGWNCGPLFVETEAAICGSDLARNSSYFSAIGGLGGTDITLDLLLGLLKKVTGNKRQNGKMETVWLDENFLGRVE